jgi:hypothetical protein
MAGDIRTVAEPENPTMNANTPSLSHEQFIHAVREIVASRANAQDAAKLRRIKLAYGFGQPGLRGVTIYSRWANGHGPQDADPFVEICAAGEESIVQLAGTTVHELAHVVAGWEAGHGKDWKSTCERLGLRCVKAAGTVYAWAMFDATLRDAILALGSPSDGSPLNGLVTMKIGKRRGKAGPCTAGTGTRGGKSRGIGSGSRMRKYVCGHGQIIRAATDDLDCTCNVCSTQFVRIDVAPVGRVEWHTMQAPAGLAMNDCR